MLEILYKILYKCHFKSYSKYKLSSFFYMMSMIFLVLVVTCGFLSYYHYFFRIIQFVCLFLQSLCFLFQVYTNKKWDKTERQLWNELQTDFNYIEFINQLIEEKGFEKSDRKYAYWYILSGNSDKLTKDDIRTWFVHFTAHYHLIKDDYENGSINK